MSISPLTLNVLTDTHYYSKQNGTEGFAYDTENCKSQKLLAESGEVLESAFEQIISENKSDIILISGDVTNNGELNAHEEFIQMLRNIKKRGKRVYVITATHDYRAESFAAAFSGEQKLKTPAASRDMLFDMYREFGPDEAIAIHRESMSYVVQLCDGYRLFALNDDTNLNGKSGFSNQCFEWIAERAEEAKRDGQFIIAMTHHPLIAPSKIYEIIGKGNMLGDYSRRIEQLADLGIQFIFTGHTHIHNISAHQSLNSNMIYDICTSSPIGYPGTYRTVTFDPANKNVKVETNYVKTPDSFKAEGKELLPVLERQLVGVIMNMVKTAGEDIDKLAHMVVAISIDPKLVYKFGWLLKPVFKFLNSLKIGTVAKWTKKETGLKPNEYKDIKDKKVVDLISELVLNLYAGESKYPPNTPTYKITMGFFSIIDSILRVLHVDLKKITKVISNTSELIEQLLYNPNIDSYNADLKIYEFGKSENISKSDKSDDKSSIRKSKKGLPVIIIFALVILAFLPLWLLILVFGYVKNKIKYGKNIKT